MQTVSELGCDHLDPNQIVFPHLGIDITIDPTAFTIFGLDIQWYAIFIVSGLFLAMCIGFRQMRRVGIDWDRAWDAIIAGILGGVVGARLYYVILEPDMFSHDWLSVFNLRNGGLAIYGGIIGAFLVGSIVAKIRKVRLLPLYDVVALGFLLGQGIGRWGNFANQEAFGTNTDSLFGMTGGRIQEWIDWNYTAMGGYNSDITLSSDYLVHPCFLYESVWCLLGFGLLFLTLRKWRKFDGQIFLMYIGWYGLERFLVEGLRTDSLMVGSLRVSQAVAAVCVVVSVILLIVCFSKVKRMGTDYVLYRDSLESKELLAQGDEKARLEDEAWKAFWNRKKASKTTELTAEETPEEIQEEKNNGETD